MPKHTLVLRFAALFPVLLAGCTTSPTGRHQLMMVSDAQMNQLGLTSFNAMRKQGKFVEARTQADRAQKQFKPGTPGWLKADDIINYRPPQH